MLCILHLIDEFLSLQLHSTELGLDVDIALVEVRSHLVLLESEQAGPQGRVFAPGFLKLSLVDFHLLVLGIFSVLIFLFSIKFLVIAQSFELCSGQGSAPR